MTVEYRMLAATVSASAAGPRAREVLDKALKQVGFIPNMYANMVNAPAVLDTYLSGYRQFREESGFTSPEQEVVFLTMLQKRGRPTKADVAPFLAAGYTEPQILYIVLAIAVKTLSNYSNHLLDTALDEKFASRAWTPPAKAA